MTDHALKVLVLAGGPDREHDVSLKSGETITRALRDAGHDVKQRDIGPDDLSALEAFAAWPGDVIFPILHGTWGEGGGLQRILDERQLPYVGSSGPVADLCMDKQRTKICFEEHGLPTPPFELLTVGQEITLDAPLVIKPLREGSSIDVAICKDDQAAAARRHELGRRNQWLLIEKFVHGKELTVGIIGDPTGYRALPPIQIVPATEFYDYDAKYQRDDTQYLFDIDLPADVLTDIGSLALAAHRCLGCRHLSRVDLIVDHEHRPWLIEVNTLPGFTDHSLLPMAARRAGIDTPQLVDQLARLALK